MGPTRVWHDEDPAAQARRADRAKKTADRVQQLISTLPDGKIEIVWRADGEVQLNCTERLTIR